MRTRTFSSRLRDFLRLSANRDQYNVTAQRNPLGYQQLTLTAAAQKLTVPAAIQGKPCMYVVIQNNGTTAGRWRDDGTAPTAGVGMVINPGSELDYAGDPTALQFIQAAAGAVLDISYYN